MPDYIVIRPGPGLPPGFLPPHMDGMWFDRTQIPVREPTWRDGSIGALVAVAVPAGRFEVREDGAVAEVWEVRV